jgi:hypothetical protein
MENVNLGFAILFELGGQVLPDGPSIRPEKREAVRAPSIERTLACVV